MAKTTKKTSRISERDILAMYEEVLPLLYDNPKGIDLVGKINKCLLKFMWYDFLHYMMEDPAGEQRQLGITYENWSTLSPSEEEQKMALGSGQSFPEVARHNYKQAIEFRRESNPDDDTYDYRKIVSQKHPKIIVGFFRVVNKSNPFSKKDLQILKELEPHILLLFRTVLTHIYHSQAFQYFVSFAKIGSHLAREHKLSDTEVKLLPDILFGYTNKEIAARHFISLATVKSHIKHILKKTGTKNRIDFITRFFTSPELLQL